MEGFHAAVTAVVEQLAEGGEVVPGKINLLPGFISPADKRYLSDIIDDFGLDATILPDLSDTMDGPSTSTYDKIQPGGTPIASIISMGRAGATIEFGRTLNDKTGGAVLADKHGVERLVQGIPIGIGESDVFFEALSALSGRPIPEKHALERGRLVDSYIDCHKYVFGKKAIIYGEEDLVVGLTAFLAEIGVVPVLCASVGKSGKLAAAIHDVTAGVLAEQPQVFEGMDFFDISEIAEGLAPDLLVGHSKGYPLARRLEITLIRVGFPIHDRMGGQRILHLGYRGTQALFDQVVNAFLAKKQGDSSVGYSYM
jgi:nitrogenase molybdenum-iron protein NifN